jgi:hypothetical protein
MATEIEPSYEHHPVDDMEPEAENWRREMAAKSLTFLYAAIRHMMRSEPHALGMYAVGYALDMIPDPMADTAAKLGVKRGAISRSARQFLAEAKLPVPNSMRSLEASDSYRKTRRKQSPQPQTT